MNAARTVVPADFGRPRAVVPTVILTPSPVILSAARTVVSADFGRPRAVVPTVDHYFFDFFYRIRKKNVQKVRLTLYNINIKINLYRWHSLFADVD